LWIIFVEFVVSDEEFIVIRVVVVVDVVVRV
jgi:hypothetical protein